MQDDYIMAKLKRQTAALHARLESHAFFAALTARRLPLECYVRQLRALAIVHSTFEREILRTDDAAVRGIWHSDRGKLDLLLCDLHDFARHGIRDSLPSTDAALALAEQIRLHAIDSPSTLLGYLYVLEGSTLGNNLHRPDIVATYQLKDPAGCRFYGAYRDDVGGHWRRFSEAMNTTLSDARCHSRITDAAVEAFSGLETLYAALYPIDPQPKLFHATQINPEAGSHPITQDAAEIAAARSASRCAWNEFGYLQQRYGARGKRFSDSDACWLVTLKELDREVAAQQLNWLAGLLATRGLPQITLERTLHHLAGELTVAQGTDDGARLRSLADHLRATRTAVIPEDSCQDLARRFDQRVGADLAASYQNTAPLLLSAVTDERNGIPQAVDPVTDWLTDHKRFPLHWISAVQDTIAEARALANAN